MSIWIAPLGWLYAGINRLRVLAYRKAWLASERLPGLVISVGNIEVGGTGKTPVVIAICQALRQAGARPVVLTRGYRSGLTRQASAVLCGEALLLPPPDGLAFHADEATLQARVLGDVPIIIGSQRYRAAQRYLAHFPPPTHWILDDGFQHLQLQRDFDLLLLDALRPFDNGRCLPAGRLREATSALTRADAVLFTRATSEAPTPALRARMQALGLPVFAVRFEEAAPQQVAGPPVDPSTLKWHLAIGIARPERILRLLEAQALPLLSTTCVGDHQAFDFERLRLALSAGGALLTTEKDYWRAPTAFAALQAPVFVLPLTLTWEDPASLPKIINSFTASSSSKFAAMPPT